MENCSPDGRSSARRTLVYRTTVLNIVKVIPQSVWEGSLRIIRRRIRDGNDFTMVNARHSAARGTCMSSNAAVAESDRSKKRRIRGLAIGKKPGAFHGQIIIQEFLGRGWSYQSEL